MSDKELSEEIIQARIKKFEEFKKKRIEELGAAVGKDIEITLPNGSKVEGKAYITTPHDIAMGISAGLAQHCVAAKINGDTLWDLGRPFEASCSLQLLKWKDPESHEIFWHSSSHILGESLERVYGVLLCNGPPIDQGFYYDSYSGATTFGNEDVEKLNQECQKIVKAKQKFERVVLTKEEALDFFKYNRFKCENIEEKVEPGGQVVVYRCGSLIDPCRGPHLLHTGKAKALKLTRNSSSYWKADENRDSLQRVYGISYPNKKDLKEYLRIQEEIKKRSHKYIGQQQSLWFRSPYAPGMYFFQPKGSMIYDKLVKGMKERQRMGGYVQVHTPNMYHSDLFKKSGHWDNYQDNMFILKVDGCDHALKPMNCPGHCVVYQSEPRTYKDLPIRMAEYGVLHRNEKRGSLTGMTRVRRFVQDDAHIFCRPDQISDEVLGCLNLMNWIYGVLNFKVKLYLATRPEKKLIGSPELWDRAEEQLKDCLKRFVGPEGSFEMDVGGGAFYGPKIDIHIEDSMKRLHQTATVQLDFNLPERFKLSFQQADGSGCRPVMVHRAIYGSLERFLSIFTEHCGGKWPFWVSPRQVIILPLSKKFFDYAEKLQKRFYDAGFDCDWDSTSNKVQKKVRNAQIAQYNYMLVVGQKEMDSDSVNVRVRDRKKPMGMVKVESFIKFGKMLLKDKPYDDPDKIEEPEEVCSCRKEEEVEGEDD